MAAAVLADLAKHGPDRLWPTFRRIQAVVPWEITDGNVQGALASATKAGWLEVSEVDDTKVYSVTDAGREALARWADTRTEELPTQRDELVLRLALLGEEVNTEAFLGLVADREHRIIVRLARLNELSGSLDEKDPTEAARKDGFEWAIGQLGAELAWLRGLNLRLRGEALEQGENRENGPGTRNYA
ncbi:MAG: hypothetical protein DYH08_18525 [Actinobacteria bacterium ATB1]|nr:hypothetical protein [Actinobacteria bacterium ATB1]